MAKKKPQTLPKEFKKYFWEYDFDKISPDKDYKLILGRIMNFGNMKSVKWMLDNFDEKDIKEFVLQTGGQQLDKRSDNFWRLYFNLPKSKFANKFWPF